ncbi:hypothetical protein SOCEGT47_072140 [Sorangium cellulosum]|uniref:TMEM205-like domain-containing protein n=1 Tax=Sorangium cellulosum TaxID=56 RepID=A0A4P2QAF7_SORCE|nr:DUF4149 domain-containing protein [Sorangium cellulosum]AUX26644.1 hypothetical protein SOCEGT47_072140 [Sorangium cellulosum]
MNDEAQFSEADLAPSPEERAASRRHLIDRVAASAAALAAGAWAGGMVALGACAAPFVFRLAPAPFSGDAMSAAFARFDQLALGAAVILLGAEVARTWAAGRRGASGAARVRRALAMVMAGCAAYVGLALTPRITELHREGARRGEGALGVELERVHRHAELAGRAEVFLGATLVVLHVFTLGARRPEDDDEDDEAVAPLPPGPR